MPSKYEPTGLPRGQKPHVPTEATKRIVTVARGCRMKMADIAALLGISHDTLTKYYQEEVRNGKTMCDLRVADALFKTIAKGDASLIKYYMNNQMGFDEKSTVDLVRKVTDDDRKNLERHIAMKLETMKGKEDDKG